MKWSSTGTAVKPLSYPSTLILLFLILIMPVSAYQMIENSSFVQQSDLATYSTNSPSYVTKITFANMTQNYSGCMELSFDLWHSGGGTTYVQFYKNGVGIGTEHNTTSTTPVHKSEQYCNLWNTTDSLVVKMVAISAVTAYFNNTHMNYSISQVNITSPANNSAQTFRELNVSYNFTGTGSVLGEFSTVFNFSTKICSQLTTNGWSNCTVPTGLIYVRLQGNDTANNSETNWTQNQYVIYDSVNTIGDPGYNWSVNGTLQNVTPNYGFGRNELMRGLYNNTFEVGTDLSNFRNITVGGSCTWSISSGSRLYIPNNTTSDLCVYTYTQNYSNADIRYIGYVFSSDTTSFQSNAIGRLYNSTHYNRYNLRNTTNALTLYDRIGAAYNVLNATTISSFGKGYWFNNRFQAYNTNYRGKYWILSDSEPEWMNIATSSNLSVGEWGVESDRAENYFDNMWISSVSDAGDIILFGNYTLNSVDTNTSGLNNSRIISYKYYGSANVGSVQIYLNTSWDGVTWTGETLLNSTDYGTLKSIPTSNIMNRYILRFNISGTDNASAIMNNFTMYTTDNNLSVPNITSFDSNISFSNISDIYIPLDSNVTFSITSNQSLTYFDWTGATNATGLTSYRVFDTEGLQTVSVYGSNENGSTQLITWNVTVWNASYVDPTKLDSNESWNVRNTTIKIRGTINIDNAVLKVWSDNLVNHSVYEYQMNQENDTDWSYNFTDLYDDIYHYNITLTNGTNNLTTGNHSTRIDLKIIWLGSDIQYVNILFLYKNTTTNKYTSFNQTEKFNSLIPSGWELVEPSYFIWLPAAPLPNKIDILRCYNSTYDEYYINNTCGLDSIDGTLGVAYSDNNIHLKRIDRQCGTNWNCTVSDVNGTIPSGFTFSQSLGYGFPTAAKSVNFVYLNNSKIKIGIDLEYGGVINYLSFNNETKNWINHQAGTGRSLQMSYYDGIGYYDGYQSCVDAATAPPCIYVTDPNYQLDWNAIQAGSAFGEPSRITSYSQDTINNTFTVITNGTFFNTLHGNHPDLYPLEITTVYSFDGELPVLRISYSYRNLDNIDHASFANQESPSLYLNGEFSYNKSYTNVTGVRFNVTTPFNYGGDGSVLFASAFNTSYIGAGVFQIKRPYYGIDWGGDSTSTDSFNVGYQILSPRTDFGINASETPGSTGNNIALIYLGNYSDMNQYFTGLDYMIEFNSSYNDYISVPYKNVIVESIYSGLIQNATLEWTNSTGTYNLSMSVEPDGLSASLNMTSLIEYNYSYRVFSYSNLDVESETISGWTEYDITPPASVTNATTTTNYTHIIMNWLNPIDVDFSHTYWLDNGTWAGNLTNTSWNISGSPGQTFNYSVQSVDVAGNINDTKIWFNGTILQPETISGVIKQIYTVAYKIYRREL